MVRRIVTLSTLAALTACGQWQGKGKDEVIPDVIGQITHVSPGFGDQSATLQGDHADEDIRLNRLSDEEKELPEDQQRHIPFTLGH
jgi:hypothetical protein